MQAEVLLTLRLQQQLFANPRRIALLKQIVQTGSINQGAKLAGVSYKSAWDAINEMNQLGDKPLVVCATGGKGGGGARVTEYGQRLIQLYDLLAQIQQKAFDVLNQDQLPLNSLLAAISRFSLQTSARNQWFGNVEQVLMHPAQPLVTIRLANSNTLIKCVITARSAMRLDLQPGKEVLVLVKAPWVHLAGRQQPDQAIARQTTNQLAGVIRHLDQDDEYSEVIVQLDEGQLLCAMLNAAQYVNLQPEIGARVCASFNADQVIIATLY